MNKIDFLKLILECIGSVTVYFLGIRFLNWLLDTLTDLSNMLTAKIDGFKDKLKVYRYLKRERDREINKAIQRMKIEEMRQKQMFDSRLEKAYAENNSQKATNKSDDDDDEPSHYEIF